jgi:Mrp family chromosome partitioning ATPase
MTSSTAFFSISINTTIPARAIPGSAEPAVDALIIPVERYGLKVMSVGFMNPGDKPLIWRGPMLHQIMREFMQRVDWGRWTTLSSICRPEQATSPSP